jgi:hypothetical protein
MAQGPNGRSYATPRYSPYQPCPDGTTVVPTGQRVQLVAPMATTTAPPLPSGQPSAYTAAMPGMAYVGIGEGEWQQTQEALPPKLCAAGWQGTRNEYQGDNDISTHLYDTLYIAPAEAASRAIDVYIDDRLWQTVHW